MSRALRLSVLGWLNLMLSAIGLVVLAGAVAVAVLLHKIDRMSAELAEDIQPTRVAAQQLQAGLRDQETAVRGYVIAADRQFLEPYADGQRVEAAQLDLHQPTFDVDERALGVGVRVLVNIVEQAAEF